MPALEQFVDEAASRSRVPRGFTAPPPGTHARPARREPVGVEAELLHERDVLGHAVVVVDGHARACRRRRRRRGRGRTCPRSSPPCRPRGRRPRSGRRRSPSPRGSRSGQCRSARHVSIVVQPFTAPAMIPDDELLARDDEEHEQRDGREHRAGEHDRVVDVVARLQLAERGLQGRVARVEHDQRPEVVGPRRHEREQAEDRHGRPRGGQRPRSGTCGSGSRRRRARPR